jgi:hypothetical protein
VAALLGECGKQQSNIMSSFVMCSDRVLAGKQHIQEKGRSRIRNSSAYL